MHMKRNDRSRTSHLNSTIELTGVLGAVERTGVQLRGPMARFRLLINWLEPESDPPTIPSGGAVLNTSDSEARLSLRLPPNREGYILPTRARSGHEIGYTAELLDYPEHADELERDLSQLIGCRVVATCDLSYYRFMTRATEDNPATEVRGYKLKVRGLQSEGVEFEFNL